MIKHWLVTGDTHCHFTRFKLLPKTEDTAIIILGDVGFNTGWSKKDHWRKKELLDSVPFTFYCVRGNHEARPQSVKGMKLVFDPDVGGNVWMEDEFPRIKYFKDYGIYHIDGYRTLVIGGAYSVDKFIRLQNDWPWFADEQLSKEEMDKCYLQMVDQSFELVLSHTCPLSFQPTDLFINGLDQDTVDNSMEVWMEKLKNRIHWNVWLFGHYHVSRAQKPHVEIFFQDIESLEDIMVRWIEYDYNHGILDWFIEKGPDFNEGTTSE